MIIPLFETFKECVGNAVDCEKEVKELHKELVSKMFNLRKEDWKKSIERIMLDKKGKTSSVILMLKDKLKPIAASQSLEFTASAIYKFGYTTTIIDSRQMTSSSVFKLSKKAFYDTAIYQNWFDKISLIMGKKIIAETSEIFYS